MIITTKLITIIEFCSQKAFFRQDALVAGEEEEEEEVMGIVSLRLSNFPQSCSSRSLST